jgi:hypothetical protein
MYWNFDAAFNISPNMPFSTIVGSKLYRLYFTYNDSRYDDVLFGALLTAALAPYDGVADPP